MKIEEFGKAKFYLADMQNYGLFRDAGSPFYTHENCGAFFAHCLTIEHPAIPERAWLIFPYDERDNIPADAISRTFIGLLKRGSTILNAGRLIRSRYFNEKDYAALFEQYSSYSYDIRL